MTRSTDASAAAPERVSYRVLPLGCGRIFTGKYDARANRFATLTRGEIGKADRATAEALERLGLAEVLSE
jgi:hypothetical protein